MMGAEYTEVSTSMLTIDAHQFGPIASGSVQLRPLTLFIGPNNSGKSYMAQLTYALLSPFGNFGVPRELAERVALLGGLGSVMAAPQIALDALQELCAKRQQIEYRLLDQKVREAIESSINTLIDGVGAGISDEIQRCFGTAVDDLNHRGHTFSIGLRQDKPSLSLRFAPSENGLLLTEKSWDIGQYQFDFREPRKFDPHPALGNLLSSLLQFALAPCHYFPAARSGVLQGHKALASFVLSRLPLVGTERFDVPRLSGVVADFISNLLRLEPNERSTDVARIGAFIESEICSGQIALETESGYAEIYYREDGKKLPLSRTSSMISELAPIVLFLKYVVNKGHLLIIEEPEAHLHPENQRVVAKAIVRLIRAGVRVLITTHSDYFVNQISNFIQMSARPARGADLGYSANDFLRPEEVAAYVFRVDTLEGSTVENLAVTAEDGIPQSEFVRVAEAIYDESVAVDWKARQ